MYHPRTKNFLLALSFTAVIIGLLGSFYLLYPAAATTLDVTPVYSRGDSTRFAVIGDFGNSGQAEMDVANLVKSWEPDFIITTGDNNYPRGSMLTIDNNIGQYYHEYIGNYTGKYGSGSQQNRFFPTFGNHDWRSTTCLLDPCRGAYFGYFSLPGNERYYDFVWGPVQFFMLDSNIEEPDGTSPDSIQGLWLQNHLATSTSLWKIVVLHHPPYSSGPHGSNPNMQWAYKEWGADMVLSGHDHTYERLSVDGLPYIVNGIGGKSIYDFQAAPAAKSDSIRIMGHCLSKRIQKH